MSIDKNTVVLLAEPGRNVRKIIKNALLERGVAKILECEDGHDLWEIVQDQDVDVVVCEWELPGIRGIDLLQKLRWSEDFSDLPFIITTSNTDQLMIQQAIQLDVTDYVVKPFTTEVLLHKMDKALAAARADEAVIEEPPGEPVEPDAAPGIDIDDIIANKRVRTYFQPIMSIQTKSIAGFEALTRGFFSEGQEEISPAELFASTTDPDKLLALDGVCRIKSMEQFAKMYAKNPAITLSLNLSPINLQRGGDTLADVVKGVHALKIAPSSVILEIPEAEVGDDKALARFMDSHRKLGFKLAFDNITEKRVNFDRVLELKPDVLKLDRTLVAGIDTELHKQDTLRAIINLANRIGADICAMGVEREEQGIVLLDYGVYTLQGYYFDRPLKKDISGIEKYYYQVEYLSYKFDRYALSKIKGKRDKNALTSGLVARMANELAGTVEEGYPDVLRKYCTTSELVLGCYVLDPAGAQVTDPVTMCDAKSDGACVGRPMPKGSRHSLKDYYLYIKGGYARYVSEPYVSPYTGRLCRTVSARFENKQGKKSVLCVDVVEDQGR